MAKTQFAIAYVATMGLPVLLGVSEAQAAPVLPDAQYFNQLQIPGASKTTSKTNGISISGGVSSAGTQNDYNIPYISASASDLGTGANSQSYLDYYMYISGPGSTVPIQLQARGEATASSSSKLAIATLDILHGRIDGDANGLSFTACTYCSGAASFQVDQMYTFETNTTYEIKMFANAFGSNGFGSAWVDPFFSAPDAFTITLSNGIGNSRLIMESVPELSTWAMMLLGFSGLIFLTYRRRNALTVA